MSGLDYGRRMVVQELAARAQGNERAQLLGLGYEPGCRVQPPASTQRGRHGNRGLSPMVHPPCCVHKLPDDIWNLGLRVEG